jgi:pimeloyl-ACP methyl ester carboxylesterase
VTLSHSTTAYDPGPRIHYVTCGDGPRTALLIHGFPQSWWKWRDVMPALAAEGWRTIAVDYRGAGNSAKPPGGYDKWTMAEDLHRVLEVAGVTEPVAVIGHDIGAMVALAYAARYREDVTHLALLDSAGLPGTTVFDGLRRSGMWHFAFHAVRDLPELLVQGREEAYIRALVEPLIVDPSGFTAEELAACVRLYQAPGAMRAVFELYRAFDQDVADNRTSIEERGKLEMPVLALSGGYTPRAISMGEMVSELAADVTAVDLPGTGHWLVEERPQETVAALLTFLTS